MTHNLSFATRYKSIKQLADIELPDFTILTGRNGSGKSHLLEALPLGHVRTSCAAPNPSEIVNYNWNSIVPADTGVFDPLTTRQQRNGFFQRMAPSQGNARRAVIQFASQNGIPLDEYSSLRDVRRLLDRATFSSTTASPESLDGLYAQFIQQLKAHAQNPLNQAINNVSEEFKTSARRVLAANPEYFLFASQHLFFEHDAFKWGNVDPFRQAFGELFSSYRRLLQENTMLEKHSGGDPDGRTFLGDAEFVKEYGSPPWDFVNEILEKAKLDFRIDHPPLGRIETPYEPILSKQSSGAEMKFADLSSGEKILMSFALCLYNSAETRQFKVFPRLLLLDEVDAPLHPSMTRFLLDTIRTVLVERRQVKVIMATHSPATVALAPFDAIYEMNAQGPEVRQVSKAKALAILTEGTPTLSVSFEGKRQVFVENATDASIYHRLYQAYSDQLHSERSLVFIGVGRRGADGSDKNCGCDQVRELVGQLIKGGNNSVFGLVDWDGAVRPQPRIHVLCPNIRDGLENLLFDPVLLLATLAHTEIGLAKSMGLLGERDTFTGLSGWKPEQWQVGIDRLAMTILGESDPQAPTTTIRYLGGMELSVFDAYLKLDDHRLEAAVYKLLPCLQRFSRKPGGLMQHIVDKILPEHPQLLPLDLIDTFARLLDSDV